MSPYTNNDPDLMEAAKELDDEFPGADYDYSLHKFLVRKNKKTGIFKKIIFHGYFYSAITANIYFAFREYNVGLLSSLIYGLIYFLVYILIKIKIKELKSPED